MLKLFITTILATLNFLQVRIGFFSKTVWPGKITFGVNNQFFIIMLQKNLLDYERIQKKYNTVLYQISKLFITKILTILNFCKI